ncbi:MAG: glycosyltransferase family 1 protein [Candidatus Gracilibacteria bacterium]|nr:glycosyltransferase family 1 protein [Candidatus Gracilibacteria bacterium]
MRIGIDCRTYGSLHGYIGKYMEHFVSYLMENEDENEYVLFFHDREAGECTIPKSSRFHIIKTSTQTGSVCEQICFLYELSKEKLDVVFFSHPNIPLFYRGKTIVLLPDLVPYFYPRKYSGGTLLRYWNNFLLRNSIKKAHAIIVLSEILKRDIIEIFDVHEENIHIIPPMYLGMEKGKIFEQNEIQKFLTKEGIGEKYILSVGHLTEHKNIPRFLQAYHLFLKDIKESIDLVLVGKEDPSYHEIRSTLIQLELQGRVHIYNIIDEEKMELLYQGASLYALPSLYEGSEESLLTPLVHNTPLIVSSLPSITSFLKKDDAVFFRPMSIIEMQEALKKVFSNPLLNKIERDMSAFSSISVSTKIMNILSFFRKDLSSSSVVGEKNE